ncbi:MAG TPA: hypothetical protein VFP97_07855 [Chitinophagaceae bacterium]|nr:hypothetical protein [Chitinophagaceae bacterium]
MEVHHHSHIANPGLHGGRKKWTHYLWEFLMLFLAVFCGFLAENQREHYVEGKREKKYIQNLVQDLVRDTVNYTTTITHRVQRERQAYQLVSLLYSPDRNKYLHDIYFLSRQLPRLNILFFPATAAMNQLKNSGAIRLIKKTNVADSILAYDVATDAFAQRQNTEIDYRNSYREAVGDVLDASVFMSMIDTVTNDFNQVILQPQFVKPLISHDQRTINNLCTRVHFIYSASMITRNTLIHLKAQATRLIELLNKEYHLR